MTKTRLFIFTAIAVIGAFGVCGQQALAQESVSNPHLHSVVIGKAPVQSDVAPDATASQVHQLYTTLNELPPLDSSNNPEWPCSGGGTDPDCSTIAQGGLVIGFPFYTWPLTTCTSSTDACGEVTWMFETDVASTKTKIDVSVTVTQGTTTKTTIYSSGTLSAGTNPGAGYTEVYALPVGFGPGDCFATGSTCGTPVAGPATITVVTTIGKQTATGVATIILSR
jgi:hypothetical protein